MQSSDKIKLIRRLPISGIWSKATHFTANQTVANGSQPTKIYKKIHLGVDKNVKDIIIQFAASWKSKQS